MITVQDVFNTANGCGDHPLEIDPKLLEGAETIIGAGCCNCMGFNLQYDTCGSYCETESFAVGRLTNGRFLTIIESSDTTGHGCQCSGTASIHETYEDALDKGLSQHHRDYIQSLPQKAS